MDLARRRPITRWLAVPFVGALLVALGLTLPASPAHAQNTLRDSTNKLVGVAINPVLASRWTRM
jgi:uncharacterized membrane protein